MKSSIASGILSMLLLAGGNASAENAFDLSCRFVSQRVRSADETLVQVSCDRGSYELYGYNNSPCKAGTVLSKFFAGAVSGEMVRIRALTFDHWVMGGLETSTNVVLAERTNSGAVLAPPAGCNTTHVDIFRR